MKGITLWEPWASLVSWGVKTVETRSWRTSYRGPLLIHAARRWDEELAQSAQWAIEELAKRASLAWPADKYLGPGTFRDTLGKALAVVHLVACGRSKGEERYTETERLFGDLRAGRFGWHLMGLRPLVPPIPCPGARGLWNVPPDVEAAVLAQLGETGESVGREAQGGLFP